MDQPQLPAYPDRMNAFMTTEHFTLQSARSIINAEIASRINIYFTTLSSVIIAAAFLAQIQEIGRLYVLFISIAFPMISLLGFFTFSRLILLGRLDSVYIRAINRIRNFYVRATPEVQQFLLFPAHDDDRSIGTYGGYDMTARGNLLSVASTVVIVNSVVTTTMIGAFTSSYFGITIRQFLPIGIGLLILIYFFHGLLGVSIVRKYMREEYLEARFPAQSGTDASSLD